MKFYLFYCTQFCLFELILALRGPLETKRMCVDFELQLLKVQKWNPPDKAVASPAVVVYTALKASGFKQHSHTKITKILYALPESDTFC